MARARTVVLFALSMCGCSSCDDASHGNSNEPFRDAWRTIHEGEFDVEEINQITIGLGKGYAHNFLNRGDVIVEFDGRRVESPEDLLDLLTADRVGRTVGLQLLRGGAPVAVTITVGERPNN